MVIHKKLKYNCSNYGAHAPAGSASGDTSSHTSSGKDSISQGHATANSGAPASIKECGNQDKPRFSVNPAASATTKPGSSVSELVADALLAASAPINTESSSQGHVSANNGGPASINDFPNQGHATANSGVPASAKEHGSQGDPDASANPAGLSSHTSTSNQLASQGNATASAGAFSPGYDAAGQNKSGASVNPAAIGNVNPDPGASLNSSNPNSSSSSPCAFAPGNAVISRACGRGSAPGQGDSCLVYRAISRQGMPPARQVLGCQGLPRGFRLVADSPWPGIYRTFEGPQGADDFWLCDPVQVREIRRNRVYLGVDEYSSESWEFILEYQDPEGCLHWHGDISFEDVACRIGSVIVKLSRAGLRVNPQAHGEFGEMLMRWQAPVAVRNVRV